MLPKNDGRLRRVFQQSFSSHDVLEPLASFDETTACELVQAIMRERNLPVVGVRRKGFVEGYVELADLQSGLCGQSARAFDPPGVIADSTPLAELVLMLKDLPRLFVESSGHMYGVVERDDMQKPAARMWLFGMVTLIEMRFSHMIDRFCPDETWQQFLSAGRVEKAKQLLAERLRRNQTLGLSDCLQLSDKAQIIARNQELRNLTRFESRRQVESVAKMLEKLRNNLAHAQDIIANDWDTIVVLAENLDVILEGPRGIREL